MIYMQLRHIKWALSLAALGIIHCILTNSLNPFLMIYLPVFLGAIPFGYIFTKWAGLGDVRSFGSGNIGATNVLRTGNKKIAVLTLLCDFLKGFLYTVIASTYIFNNPWDLMLTAMCLIVGHISGIWLNGKGGKGVATALGTYFAFSWPLGLFTLIIWITCAKMFKISSLAALIATTFSAITLWIVWFFKTDGVDVFYLATFVSAVTIMIVYTHRANINRIGLGLESKIGDEI